jgi:hypothetical protein
MVEAGILAPIFAMMMMFTVYLGGVYETKYKSIMQERFNTWSYASNNCTNAGGGSGDTPESATQDQSGNMPTGNQYTNQAQGGPQTTSTLFVGHGQSSQTWSYAPTLRFNGGSPKQITTEGWVVCNSASQGANIFGYLGNILGSIL